MNDFHENICQDIPGENIEDVFDEAGEWIERCLQVSTWNHDIHESILNQNIFQSQGKVLVNCFVGSSRSASVVLAFLMRFR